MEPVSTLPERTSLVIPTAVRRACRRWAPVLTALLVVASVWGCATGTREDNPFAGAGQGGASSIRVVVENLNFNDATLHALSSGRRYRMGTVSGRSNAAFEVPWPNQGDLRIEIDLLAGAEYTTRAIFAGPGDRLELVVERRVERSYLQR